VIQENGETVWLFERSANRKGVEAVRVAIIPGGSM
jgi:hypothetical protein